MPKGSSKTRFDNIAKEGASVTIEDVNYDECVRRANALAESTEHGVMVQDTAWDGYEKIPSWIMEGYGTMASEASEQLGERPTHIFVQAGVGSLAGGHPGLLREPLPGQLPDHRRHGGAGGRLPLPQRRRGRRQHPLATGDLQTIMAGLACGEPNTIGFDILKNHTSFFVSCPDWVAAKGMRMLGAPVKGDPQVVSGESGAVGMGLVATLMKDPEYKELKEAIGLDENSVVLMFSTEGDTDPDNYKAIVWGGKQV